MEDSKSEIMNALSQLGESATQSVIVQLKPSPTVASAAPASDAFPTRQAYREALIAHQKGVNAAEVAAVAARFEELGLATEAATLSRQIVVKGRASDIRRALEDDAVAGAQFDTEIELIAPHRRRSAVPNT